MRAVHPLPSGEAETLAGQGHIKEDNRDIVRLPALSATHLSGERDERGENDRDSPSADVGLSGMHSPAWFQGECSDDAGCRAASRVSAATMMVAAMARGEGSPTDVEQRSGGVGAPPPHAGPPGVVKISFCLRVVLTPHLHLVLVALRPDPGRRAYCAKPAATLS